MCGRYTLTGPDRIAAAFPSLTFEPFSEYRLPRFNIAPRQRVLGVRNDGRRTVEALTWGIGGRINARAESLAARRGPLRRRCIQFADGFYEWRDRQPVYYTLRSGEPFAFASVWEPHDDQPECAIVTCEPNALVAAVHDRMPVILTGSAVDLWIDPDPLPPDVAAAALRPLDPALMASRRVSRRVNNARYDTPDVLSEVSTIQERLL